MPQVTLYPTHDTYVDQAFPNINYGNDTVMGAIATSGEIKYIYIKFDLSSVPEGATINSAVLSGYTLNVNSGGCSAQVNRCTSDWTEDAVNWNNKPTDTDTGSIALSNAFPTINAWYDFSILSIVAGWCNGTYANYGIKILITNAAQWLTMRSSEGVERPYITIDYTPSVPVNYSVDTVPYAETDVYSPDIKINQHISVASVPNIEMSVYMPIIRFFKKIYSMAARLIDGISIGTSINKTSYGRIVLKDKLQDETVIKDKHSVTIKL